MKIHALSYDLARSQRAQPEHLRHVVDTLAELGFNMMVLNLEHRFDFPSLPGIAPAGSLTPDMTRDLVECGRACGVAVVPQPNLIGHCEGIGATELYARLSCDPWQQSPWGGYEQLNLTLEDARDLVRKAMRDVLDAFPGDYVHIGGDEVRRMDCLFLDHPERRVPAMLEQFDLLLSLARAAGRRVMMWGDMPLHYPELMKALPRDVIICDWHYGSAGSRETLARYKAEGFAVLAAPSTGTCGGFGGEPAGAAANIEKMVGDALDLGLEGFLLTHWESGFGSGFDLGWPWVALAAAVARGETPEPPETFLARFAEARYGVEGESFARLHLLLSRDLAGALAVDGHQPPRARVTLRKLLFRGCYPFADLARPKGYPGNGHQAIWEPSPFLVWLYLRPILTGSRRKQLEEMAVEAARLADRLESGARDHAHELCALLALARGFAIMVERFHILGTASAHYHRAALAQHADPTAFRVELDHAADAVESIRPGLAALRQLVERLDESNGLDAGELEWLDIQARSLSEHVAALRARAPEGDALLEFGEFLRRPAHITPRLTWR